MCGWLELQIIESAILLTMHEVSSIRLQSIACILLTCCNRARNFHSDDMISLDQWDELFSNFFLTCDL